MGASEYRHAVLFYRDQSTLARTVAAFLTQGLLAGESALVVATPAHRALITNELRLLGVYVPELREAGRLCMLDCRKTLSRFMAGDGPDPLLFNSAAAEVLDPLSIRAAGGRIRAYGEMVDLLWQEGNADGALRLEVLWNCLRSSYHFSLLCSYQVAETDARSIVSSRRAICDQHTHVSTDVTPREARA